MWTAIAALGPAIVPVVLALFKAIGVSKANQQKFLQNVINASNDDVVIKLKNKYRSLLSDGGEWK